MAWKIQQFANMALPKPISLSLGYIGPESILPIDSELIWISRQNQNWSYEDLYTLQLSHNTSPDTFGFSTSRDESIIEP